MWLRMGCDGERTWWVCANVGLWAICKALLCWRLLLCLPLYRYVALLFALVLSLSPLTLLAYGNFGEAVLQIWIWSWRRSLGLENWSCECAEFDCCECHVIEWNLKCNFLCLCNFIEWQPCMSIYWLQVFVIFRQCLHSIFPSGFFNSLQHQKFIHQRWFIELHQTMTLK